MLKAAISFNSSIGQLNTVILGMLTLKTIFSGEFWVLVFSYSNGK